MSAAAKLRKKRMAAGDDVAPTPERQARGDVERAARSIADEEGRPARGALASSMLA